MEKTFESLPLLILNIFQQLQTSLLSVDRIFLFIQDNNFTFQTLKKETIPAKTLTKRMIANALDSSDLFVRAGNSHNKTWALRPNNPLFQCDAAIAVTVEQLLSQSGPLSLEQLVSAINLPGADVTIIERVLAVHSNEFTQLPSGCIWFSNQPQPVASEFDNIEQALVFAFNFFPEGATVEELSWFLCLSKHNGLPITKMCISHELVRRSDLFVQIHRLKYAIAGSPACNRSISNSTSTSTSVSSFTNDEDVFNPDAFFCDNFQFSPE